jgi:hypothetical protein
MKVFISQAQERSRALATELQVFIRRLVPATEPWMSTTGIEKGTRWNKELTDNLEQAGAGLICLTTENLNDRWILFESGALSRKPADKVWTYLLDLEYTQVEPPLSQFQHTKAEKNDTWQLVASINKTVETSGEKPRHPDDLRDQFETLWPKLEERIQQLRTQRPGPPARKRGTDEILEELLGLVRDMTPKVDKTTWRQDKSLKMLHQIYEAVLGTKAPSLAALYRIVEDPPKLRGAGGFQNLLARQSEYPSDEDMRHLVSLIREWRVTVDRARKSKNDDVSPKAGDDKKEEQE